MLQYNYTILVNKTKFLQSTLQARPRGYQPTAMYANENKQYIAQSIIVNSYCGHPVDEPRAAANCVHYASQYYTAVPTQYTIWTMILSRQPIACSKMPHKQTPARIQSRVPATSEWEHERIVGSLWKHTRIKSCILSAGVLNSVRNVDKCFGFEWIITGGRLKHH